MTRYETRCVDLPNRRMRPRWLESSIVIALLLTIVAMSATASGSGIQAPSLAAPAQSRGPDAEEDAHGFEYADRCLGEDIGAKIMSCLDRLPTGANGYKAGTIVLPNTASEPGLASWSTAVILGPGVNLIGQGLFASSFHCTVAGPCLNHDATGSRGSTAHSVLPNTVYEGFTITGNGASGQEILHFSDAQGVAVRDVAADGAQEPGGSCIHFEDVNWWTERNEFTDVSTLYGCHIGWRFTSQPANRYQPHPSFGYNRFLDIRANTVGSQTAFSFEGSSYIYDSTFRVTINKGGVGSILFHMQDTAEYYLNETHVNGEENGSGGYRFDLGPANVFTYYGEVNLSVVADRLAHGSTLSHYGDDGGYGPRSPTQFFNGVLWQRAAEIPAGTNLDQILSCGTFAGRQVVNAPPELGNHFVRIEVICSADRDYLSQIAYLMEYPSADLRPRAWQRIKVNGTWGRWRETSWTDQLPLSGQTEQLPPAIPARTCITLKASIPGAREGMVVVASPSVSAFAIQGLDTRGGYVSAPGIVSISVCNTTDKSINATGEPVFHVRILP